jgi:hypothetical protein
MANHTKRNQKRASERDSQKKPVNDDQKSFVGFGHCFACGTPLCTQGGCAGTGLCGPCCTGEADTAGEY